MAMQLERESSTTVDRDRHAVLRDTRRLKALLETRLLDSPPEEAFDRITRLAAKILRVPAVLISLVDDHRQFFKSCMVAPESLDLGRGNPLGHSFCKHVVMEAQPLIVEDTRLDPIGKDNGSVALGVTAYAGVPLITRDGYCLGSFCAIDTQPRKWTRDDIDLLKDFSAAAIAEIELRRLALELRHANQAKEHFFAALSHELRTPLSPVLLIGGALATDADLPEKFREDIECVVRNIQLEARLIDSLLDVTRIVTGKMQMQVSDIDLHSVLKDSVRMCNAESLDKSIVIRCHLEANAHLLRCDGPKMNQVFCNILKNAIKFSPAKSEITIRTTNTLDELLRVEVIDAGIGIPSDMLCKIFDPFEQGGDSITRRHGGLGLGLAICKGIVEAHGGVISARSEGPGHGTTMRVEIMPLAAVGRLQTAA